MPAAGLDGPAVSNFESGLLLLSSPAWQHVACHVAVKGRQRPAKQQLQRIVCSHSFVASLPRGTSTVLQSANARVPCTAPLLLLLPLLPSQYPRVSTTAVLVTWPREDGPVLTPSSPPTKTSSRASCLLLHVGSLLLRCCH